MLIAYTMLKLLWKAESSLIYAALRIFRGPLGHAVDKTLDDIEILHDSPHFLIVNKSCDVILNHYDRTVTVEKQLERLYPDLVNPSLKMSFYFCHRLDYSTSGVLCIAKHKKACAAAVKSFEQRKSQKFYLAIVRGLISEDILTISEPIGNDTREKFIKVRMATKSSPFCSHACRDAKTKLVVLERGVCYDYPATKVLLRPITGRRHQLRLHLNHIGHTIVGDFTYSNRTDLHPYRMFLHAYKLALPNNIEDLDITTNDPFASFDVRNKWQPQQTVHTIESAIDCLLQVDR
ncbi:RNA pseudouridylate synthase domain-containing protein 1 [Orchesella cincta]|uniref:RNA pseudouridylate synthase domain-containing protein 1 n=1 Tax=Orchesella cincta TaxID=48709 RepID=A0A1D2NCB2_ORCCI|nr:RNA pseudouridylate synthase domain-containing protein 1 [Orchesella cincta]